MQLKTVIQIMLVAAPLGAVDVVYFHIWRFRLYQSRGSRFEQITHLLRGAVFPLGLAILLIGRPEGTWFWIVLTLFGVDLVNSVLDVLAEPASRAPIGVPAVEAGIHYVGATAMGIVIAVYVGSSWSQRSNATALVGHDGAEIARTTLAFGLVSVIGGVLLVCFEGTLFVRSLRAGQDESVATTYKNRSSQRGRRSPALATDGGASDALDAKRHLR